MKMRHYTVIYCLHLQSDWYRKHHRSFLTWHEFRRVVVHSCVIRELGLEQLYFFSSVHTRTQKNPIGNCISSWIILSLMENRLVGVSDTNRWFLGNLVRVGSTNTVFHKFSMRLRLCEIFFAYEWQKIARPKWPQQKSHVPKTFWWAEDFAERGIWKRDGKERTCCGSPNA